MLLISIILNLITILIVLGFIVIVYLSYRHRPNFSATPLDVMRDIVGGQAGHARIYKASPHKHLLTGPIGSFDMGYKNTHQDIALLTGNSYEYTQGEKPWENVPDANFGSRNGISMGHDDVYHEHRLLSS